MAGPPPLVLLQVEDTAFDAMLFFKRALADHMPLAYLTALRQFATAQRQALARQAQVKQVVEVLRRPLHKMGSLRRGIVAALHGNAAQGQGHGQGQQAAPAGTGPGTGALSVQQQQQQQQR